MFRGVVKRDRVGCWCNCCLCVYICASVHDLQLTAMEGLGREVMLNGTVMLLLGTFTFSR